MCAKAEKTDYQELPGVTKGIVKFRMKMDEEYALKQRKKRPEITTLRKLPEISGKQKTEPKFIIDNDDVFYVKPTAPLKASSVKNLNTSFGNSH